MFLLLIFVLLSAKFETSASVAVNLPAGGEKEPATAPETAILSITAEGKIYLDKKMLTLSELKAAVAALRQKKHDPVLVINADKDVAYGIFAAAMDQVKQAGQTKFSLKFTPSAP